METGVGSSKDIHGETDKAVQTQIQMVRLTLGMRITHTGLNIFGQRRMVPTGGQTTAHSGQIPMEMAMAITHQRAQQLQINSQQYRQRLMIRMAMVIQMIGLQSTMVKIEVVYF